MKTIPNARLVVPIAAALLWLGSFKAAALERETVKINFANGLVDCEIYPAGDSPIPDSLISTLSVAAKTALEHIGPPPQSATLVIRLQAPPTFYKRAKTMFRAEAIASQVNDEIHLYPGTDSLKLAFRLGHELSHWLVYRQQPARPPLWLDEGLANWIGAAAAEACARPLSQTVQRPKPAHLDGHLFSIAELLALKAYPRSPAAVGAFYWQAESLVSALIKKLGPAEFKIYLALLSSPNAPTWDTPLRERWYFTDRDIEWFSRQIQPNP